METILTINGLSKSFTIHGLKKQIKALDEISLSVKKGEFIGITGKSGSGKSTIFRLIYPTYLPQEGEIWYNSEKFRCLDLAQADLRQIIYLRKYEISYVSQFLRIMPRTTAIEAVKYAALEKGLNGKAAQREAEKILSHFELDQKLWESYPSNFSGGEKLRLNIAQAMVKQPRLLLLDEPTASLDMGSKLKVRELILQLMQAKTTMLGIFHDLVFMEELCHREYRIENGRLFACQERVCVHQS